MAPRDTSRRSERSRRAILTAAGELLADVGFARLTIEAIAARAGVGKTTIYRWWPSKGAVVFDALLEAQGPSSDARKLPDTGDVERDLRDVLRAVIDELADPQVDRLQRTIAAEIQHDTELAGELVERLLQPQLEATEQRLRAGQEAGQLDPHADVTVATELLFGPIFHRWLLRTTPLDDAYADRLVVLVLDGLRPRP